MNDMTQTGLTDSIKEFCQSGKPVLGICLGMQLLASSGRKATPMTPSRAWSRDVSHSVRWVRSACRTSGGTAYSRNRRRLFDGIPDGNDVYFVHSMDSAGQERLPDRDHGA